MRAPEPVVLARGDVRLEPLSEAHVDDLLPVAQDPEVWRWLSAPQPHDSASMAAVIEAAVADPARIAWAVLLGGRAVGSSSYLDVDRAVEGLEVGWTWYARSAWATHVNPTCKLLLLGHAFDTLGAQRVTLKLDACNGR